MTMQFNVGNYKLVDLMMKQKNLEINLVAYYVEQMENDILFSDDYEESGYHIYSHIDAVSYTHLDVYKRQVLKRVKLVLEIKLNLWQVMQFMKL